MQAHSAAGSPRAPHGQRFIVATSRNRAGNTARPATRATPIEPSSSGCRSASSDGRGNSASSSRSSTPRCARLASPGRGPGPAADDRGRRRRVVRRAERRPYRPAAAPREQARDRVDPRHLERLVAVERRQDARQPAREHRLAGSGRPGEQQIVPAGRRDLQRAARSLLAADVARGRAGGSRSHGGGIATASGSARPADTRPPRRGGGSESARRLRARPRPPTRRRRGAGRARPAARPPPRRSRRGPVAPGRRERARRALHGSASRRRGSCRDAASTASAIGQVEAAPSFRRPAGARLTVMRRSGHSSSALVMPQRTRSFASWQALSGRPTIANAGTPR